MPMNITNRSKQLLVIPLNSGATLHLAPGEEAGGIDPIETKNNSTLEKMAQRGWVSVAETDEVPRAKRGRGRG
ncbi:MAG: hypothetical protein MCM46_09205 [Candidatus Manganitrophus sp. SB1]|nr:hypothetical protein [Candidatus Manganitrophus morganii]